MVGQAAQLGRGKASDFFVAAFDPDASASEGGNGAGSGFAGNDSFFAQRDRIRLLDDPGADDGLLDFSGGGDKDDDDPLALPQIR